MRRRVIVALAIAVGFFAGPVAVGAIETESYGVDVAEPSDDGRLHIPLRVDRTTSGKMRVWNKTDQPLTLNLSVVGAVLADDGRVTLGGDGKAAEWASVEPSRVDLAPKATASVTVSVRASGELPEEDQVVAVLATPVVSAETAVVQRLALTAFLEPAGPSFIESLGPWPWVAGVLIVVVGGLAVWVRRRGAAGSADAAGAAA